MERALGRDIPAGTQMCVWPRPRAPVQHGVLGEPAEATSEEGRRHVCSARVGVPAHARRDRSGYFFQSVGPAGSHGFHVDLAIDRQWYLELRELGSV